jgi:hypothetical protein
VRQTWPCSQAATLWPSVVGRVTGSDVPFIEGLPASGENIGACGRPRMQPSHWLLIAYVSSLEPLIACCGAL